MSHQSDEIGRDERLTAPARDDRRDAEAPEAERPADQLNPYHQQAHEFDADNPGGEAMDRQ